MNEIEDLMVRHPELKVCKNDVDAALKVLLETFRAGGKVLVCGNGGSAADTEHICGELLKKFKMPQSGGDCAWRGVYAQCRPISADN